MGGLPRPLNRKPVTWDQFSCSISLPLMPLEACTNTSEQARHLGVKKTAEHQTRKPPHKPPSTPNLKPMYRDLLNL